MVPGDPTHGGGGGGGGETEDGTIYTYRISVCVSCCSVQTEVLTPFFGLSSMGSLPAVRSHPSRIAAREFLPTRIEENRVNGSSC